MPGPVTHIILADKVFDRYFQGKNRRLFYLGTLFPDIRYLGVIDREQTHPEVSSMEEVAAQGDFRAGMAFHALTDHIKRGFMAAGVETKPPAAALKSGFLLKLAEDVHAYAYRNNWQPIAAYLDHIPDEAAAYGIGRTHLATWHRLLQHYLSKPPEPEQLIGLARLAGIPQFAADQSMPNLAAIKNNQAVAALVADFFEHFEALISKQSAG